MPRKQRFKPSRKPMSNPSPGVQNDDRKEVHPDDVEIETGTPARGTGVEASSAIEKSGSARSS